MPITYPFKYSEIFATCNFVDFTDFVDLVDFVWFCWLVILLTWICVIYIYASSFTLSFTSLHFSITAASQLSQSITTMFATPNLTSLLFAAKFVTSKVFSSYWAYYFCQCDDISQYGDHQDIWSPAIKLSSLSDNLRLVI